MRYLPIDWTTIIVSLGSALISGLFALLAKRQSKEATKQAVSASVHADRAVRASLQPRNDERHDESIPPPPDTKR